MAQRKVKSKVKTSTKSKSNTFEFGVFNLATPQHIEEPQDLSRVYTDFIPFGQNNLFPQYLAELKRKSSTHRSVLAQKTIFTSGAKFVTKNDNLKSYIRDVNADGESLRDVYKKLADDYYTFGNAYLEGVLYEGGMNLYHVDATTVRISKTKKDVYIHPDWARYKMEKKKMNILPLYPVVRNNRFIIHFKDYEPTFNFYGLPDYVAALEHVAVDYEIGKWNHTKFQNGFQPSAIVEISGDMGEDEAKKMVKEAQKKFVGEGNNGKILFIVKNGDTSPANVQIIKDDQDGSWLDLQKITDQNIITAHRWQPSLSGIVSSGKMNNTGSEIRIAYDLCMTTVVKDTSDMLLNGIRTLLFKELNYEPEELMIHFEPPISYITDIDVKEVLTINEQRKLLDEDFPLLEGGDMFIADREIIVTQRDDDGDGQIEEQKSVTDNNMANVNNKATLVTAAEVISNSFTNANTDPALISSNSILLAELAHIKPVLGKKFYEELKTQHDPTGTLSTANQTLMDDFLTRTLCWFVRFEVINEVQSNSSSMGIVNNIDEFSSIVDPSDLNAYKQDTYRKASVYLKDMMDYIEDDDQNGLYPTYESNRPNRGFAYKNHGIIMYDSIYTKNYYPRTYTSWKDYCPCDDC